MKKKSHNRKSYFRILHAPCSVLHDTRGQLLIESIIAIGLVVVGMMAILTFIYSALSLNRVVADQLTGTYLAEEGIEITKNILDSNRGKGKVWNDGFSQKSYIVDYMDKNLKEFENKFLNYDSNAGYTYGGGNPTAFKRKITITPIPRPNPGPVNEIQVNSVVTWATKGGGQYSVDLEDHFFNWR